MSSDEHVRSESVREMLNLPPLTFDDLVELGRQIPVPRQLPSRPPAVGDVWRARWDDESVLVVLLDLGKSQVRVAPCTFDVPTHAGPNLPELGKRPLYVSWRHQASIPAIALDACFGAALMRGPSDARDSDDSRDEQLSAELARLTAQQLTGQGDGSLPAMLEANAVELPRLVEELKVLPATALKIRRGKKPVTPAQAKALAGLLSVTEDVVLQGNPRLPDDLTSDLQEYQYRARLQHLGEREHLTDSEAWSRAAYGVLLSAARHTGGRESNWHLRIDRYFESEGVGRG